MASCVNNSDLILFSLVPLTFRASWLCVFALEYTETKFNGRQASTLAIFCRKRQSVTQKVDVSNFSCHLEQSYLSVDTSRQSNRY